MIERDKMSEYLALFAREDNDEDIQLALQHADQSSKVLNDPAIMRAVYKLEASLITQGRRQASLEQDSRMKGQILKYYATAGDVLEQLLQILALEVEEGEEIQERLDEEVKVQLEQKASSAEFHSVRRFRNKHRKAVEAYDEQGE